jgi:hypothetical protein
MFNLFDICASATHRAQRSCAVAWAIACLLLGATSLTPAHAQRPGEVKVGAQAAASSPRTPVASRPLWTELNLSQQLALQPLASAWSTLNAAHKRKWIALSSNYARMTPEEQTVLHSRMTGWAALSQQQRVQARLNFAEVKQVPAGERKAKWEAYQALTEVERRALAERASTKPHGAALPAGPVNAKKLFAPVPVSNGKHTPRIQLAPQPSAPKSATAKVPTPTLPVAHPAATVPAPMVPIAPISTPVQPSPAS